MFNSVVRVIRNVAFAHVSQNPPRNQPRVPLAQEKDKGRGAEVCQNLKPCDSSSQGKLPEDRSRVVSDGRKSLEGTALENHLTGFEEGQALQEGASGECLWQARGHQDAL